MNQIYYYKRSSGTWVFLVDGQTIVKDAEKGAQYHRMLRFAKKELRRLYLDLFEDFEKIRSSFFTPEYWVGRTWAQEENL
jgi:hypothetical protein